MFTEATKRSAEAVLMIRPQPLCCMCGSAALAAWNAEEKVDGDDGVPSRGGTLGGRRVLDAGVVDEDVDTAEGIDAVLDQRADLVGAAHVGAVEAHRRTMALRDLRGDALALLPRLYAVDDHARPFRGEGLRHRPANATGSAGDHRCLVRECHVRVRSVVLSRRYYRAPAPSVCKHGGQSVTIPPKRQETRINQP
ncbi:MAG: hypothetical protein U5L11_06425 [Arhodomonas sp.]|nr:hypothetical protein [Arhodomonas sp.]